MFRILAGTMILIQAPHGKFMGPQTVVSGHWSLTDTAPWKPYVTKEDKLYDKHEVWDAIGVHNERDDIPNWARHNILEHNKVILNVDGKYAMCNPVDIDFLD